MRTPSRSVHELRSTLDRHSVAIPTRFRPATRPNPAHTGVAPNRQDETVGRYPRAIVLAYDGSDPARRALDRTAELASEATAVTVVSVVPQRVTSLGPEPLDPVEVEEHARQLADARERLAQHGVSAGGVEGYGDPARVVLDEARAVGADLVAVGSHDKTLIERVVRGSVSTRLVHEADCDVLVVR